MASGNVKRDSLTLIAMLAIVEGISDSLIPQTLAQLTPPLFEDRRFFVHVPQ